MCGIVGLWHRDSQPVSADLLVHMRDRMRVRGPDDAGVWLENDVGLGHRRLSIIDLSPLGHQPMIDEETGSVITFNGEVFNFADVRAELEQLGVAFKSRSDTEVLLKAYRVWGRACVSRFVGMFAFAIWDRRQRGFFLARDRLGIKPLYYLLNERLFCFASRLGPIIAHPLCSREIDPEALGLYLEVGFVPWPWSMLKDVRKLGPGHTLWVDEHGVREECYWSVEKITIDRDLAGLAEDALTDRLDQLLRESIRLRLIADVPLGAFLSGGIDSSLVVALMRQISPTPPKTFTIGFQEKAYDESGEAAAIAKHLGTDHHEKIMGSRDLLPFMEKHAEEYDEPFGDWSSLPTMMVSQFAREHVTVSLSGDGGDELFAGYHYYPLLAKLRLTSFLPQILRDAAGGLLGKTGNHQMALLGKALGCADGVSTFAFLRSMVKDYGRDSLTSAQGPSLREVFLKKSGAFSPLDDVSTACRLDLSYYLPDDILQKVDVASMAFGLEARVPLLDHRVVEFAQSLPVSHKLRYGKTKILLRNVLARYVPARLFERPKKGFCVPIKEWFREDLRSMIGDELSAARVQELGLLKPAGVAHLLDLHWSGKRDTHPMLWVLLSLLRWDRQIRQAPRWQEGAAAV